MAEASTVGASRLDEGGDGVHNPAPAARGRARRYAPPVASVLVYAVVAVLAFWPVEPFSKTNLSYCACSDPVQEAWFLAWPAFALRHGLNPFFTSLLNYPHGVNLALNTSMPLLGILSAPIAWIRGPIAAFNAMMRLSLLLSATSMLFVVHRLARWWPAAFLAGLLYGFSPYMTGEAYGHLFLTFVPLPPLIMLCLYELSRRSAGSRLRLGLLLGALCVLQFLISIEVLVTTGVCCAAVALIAALRHPAAALRQLRGAAGGLAAALGVFVPLIAYPLWFFLRGDQHVVGPPHAVANLAPLKADLLSYIVPTLNQQLGTSHLLSVGTSFVGGDRPENGLYLGIPLLLLLVYLVVRFRSDEKVVLGALLGVVGIVLTLGTPLAVDGHSTGIPLPFDVLLHVPLVKGVAAVRFDLYEQLGAALVIGLGLARLRAAGWRAGDRRRYATASVVAVAIVALVPMLPRYPIPHQGVGLPTYMTTSAVEAIPPQSVVLTYPYDVDPVNEAMMWQVVSGMRFAIFGGQASTPGPGGAATSAVPLLQPAVVQQLFAAGFYGDVPTTGAPLPPFDSATLAGIDAFCRRYHVGTIVVEPLGVQPAPVLRYLTAALGVAPVVSGGVDVWSGVAADLARAGAGTP
jgi:hypothetical protein